MVASVPSIASTATQAAPATTTVWPTSYCARWRPTARPYSMSRRSSSSGARRVSTPGRASSGSSKAVELMRVMPSSARTLATAPMSASVLRVRSESSSLASRQSGRMLEKICLCLTCPAMTARLTPSRLKVSISRDNSPNESQCTDAAPRDSISGKVSSLIAATTTSRPRARAASSTSSGKRPLPAMRPMRSDISRQYTGSPNWRPATGNRLREASRMGLCSSYLRAVGRSSMEAVVGIFRSRAAADQAVDGLRGIGIPPERITFMTPETNERELAQIPTTNAEEPGIGKTISSYVGAAIGAAGGMALGGAVAGALAPGAGPVIAAGLGAAAILGAGGAAVGAEIGEETERTLDTGIPRDDLPLYRLLLTEGRSLVLAFLDSEEMEKAARLVMQNNGSEDLEEARTRFEKAA